MIDDIDIAIRGAHLVVNALEDQIDSAKERRALTFALANEKGVSSGDIARALGLTPMQALHIIRAGHRILKQRRDRIQRRAAA